MDGALRSVLVNRQPEEWSKGLVGFKPAPVFDVSQTEGEPLPELDTAATGCGRTSSSVGEVDDLTPDFEGPPAQVGRSAGRLLGHALELVHVHW